MLEIINKTSWPAQRFEGWNRRGQSAAIVVVRAGYQFDASGELTPREAAIEPADRYSGEPNESSLAAAGDGVAFKDGADCLFHGTAHPLQPGATAREVRVSVTNGEGGFDKRLRVAGRRQWRATIVGMVPSEPRPLEATPVIYEHAFGGADVAAHEIERRNPVGTGFSARRGGAKGAELPRIEYRDDTMTRWGQRPRPAGLGPVPPGWQPRRAAIEQLDQNAAANGRCPYPEPLPQGLYNVAPTDQQLDAPLRGGEHVYLEGIGVASGGPVTLSVPTAAPAACVATETETERLPLALDTLIVDADSATLDCVWRGSVAEPIKERNRRWAVITERSREAA